MLEISQLRAFSQLPPPLLTAYVDSNPGKQSNRGPSPEYMIWLNSAGGVAAAGVAENQRKLFIEQLERVQTFLRDSVTLPKGALIFAGADAWTYVPLRVEVKNELHWGKPLLFPLLGLFGKRKPCSIVVVDHAGVRFFRHWLGEMTELEERKFEIDISQWRKKDMGKVARARESSLRGAREMKKTRGSARDTFEHRMDAQYRRLCGEVARRARELSGEQGLAGLFLVGPDRLIEPIAEALPREFESRLVMMNEDLGRIFSPALEEHIGPAVAQWEQAQELEAVEALLADANGVVTGIDSTLAELQRGSVRILVVPQQFNIPLSQCAKCGWMDRSAADACPVCGEVRHPVDLRESLPDLAWSHGAEIEVVGGEASIRLAGAGGIAGWLRQPKEAGANRSVARAG
ncbi:MAG TPA: VLRF1 family aeRF1-type release factor [Patescibacteria group bacterium]|nr:VLRF1 family aeRF1-type release factor [Patescibacteria group bacterium]